jgi:hypothetical protein
MAQYTGLHTTAFVFCGSAVIVVSFLKYAMSPGSFQGMVPSLPMPSFRVAATTIWNASFCSIIAPPVIVGFVQSIVK